MSADNWRVCPRCMRRKEKAQEEMVREVAESYGKVPADLYLLKCKKAADGFEIQCAYREDYELGTSEDGKLYVIYHGWCQDCGYGVDFRHEQAVPGLED